MRISDWSSDVCSSDLRTVVEFGSGVSTLVTAECLRRKGGGSIITNDHHSSFAAETAQRLRALGLEADVRSVPLCPLIAARNGWGGAWYDTEELPSRIDLLIVDGPPWFLHPLAPRNAASLFSSSDRLRLGQEGGRTGRSLW